MSQDEKIYFITCVCASVPDLDPTASACVFPRTGLFWGCLGSRHVCAVPLKTDNCFKESNNKINFYTLSTTLMCNHMARRGGEREGERQAEWSKNILPHALIVSASVLLLLSPRQAESTTENTHSKFPLSPFPLIKLPSLWLIAGPDRGLVLSLHHCLLYNSARISP